ncbi:MAG: ATP-binding protein [Pseudomonadota bacterium]
MDPRFLPHNTHLEAPERFAVRDPQLHRLEQQTYIHYPALLKTMAKFVPGIYTLGGGRQVGKSTLIKQWMNQLLESGVAPKAIAYFSGELINDHHTLYHLLQSQIQEMPEDQEKFITIDEVTYIHDWDKAIKYAADAGILQQTVLVLTGSDLNLIQEARMRFPGRRGKFARPDLHLYSLSFKEYFTLRYGQAKVDEVLDDFAQDADMLDTVYEEFSLYLMHGGYLTAINDYASSGKIFESTLLTYSDWIRGDMLKRNKQESYLREILIAIIERYNSQVTWNALAQHLSIEHPMTVADYIALLQSMDAVFVQQVLQEDKMLPSPKKARKVMFTDPFIFHSLQAWVFPVKDPFEQQIRTVVESPLLSSKLVEACVATHYKRFYPTYYIKAEGEVDVAYLDHGRFWPVEVKWSQQLRTKDLKQILKYDNGKILTKSRQSGMIQHIPTLPVPIALLQL